MPTKHKDYSSTPLIKKLGIHEGDLIRIISAPENYVALLGKLPDNTEVCLTKTKKKNLIHYFITSMKQLEQQLFELKSEIVQDGIIWISWYKKSSKIATDVTEDKIREQALFIGLVDVKVCSIDDKWSGLKLVIPLKKRTNSKK